MAKELNAYIFILFIPPRQFAMSQYIRHNSCRHLHNPSAMAKYYDSLADTLLYLISIPAKERGKNLQSNKQAVHMIIVIITIRFFIAAPL